ncbi:16S rRNA (cytosine(1402)-N(4))-methyltransferase RsmH [Candidatus Bandiella euplotis]|uniref:Ribosomal RNA small subunit methyltransferase H n=1 Tax=Candidatus Bandiella euplotis TaxID=1664265 RepID=A0ABZ0UPX7_9RICK|nr:16S rRNA (cytosine(1402)-N(4))-methyltransferase RsmH [Candidatus Bandiella woodruffii]WPX97064.1 Ribosomal RNA small subunit methyltransferase H [Candidatus Bandiella woodruffii]
MQVNELITKQDHTPVLLAEALEMLQPQDNKVYIDATFGAGGYTKAILNKANCTVIAIDCDSNAQKYAEAIGEKFRNKFHFVNDNFINIDEILKNLNINSVDGIVFDLGVSSMQLDNKERGFSFSGNGPLDMRMDNRLTTTAEKLVNELYEKELADLIYNYGGERKSRSIAKNIVQFRQRERILTTAKLVEAMNPNARSYQDNIHFATRTFQALRIMVNNELETLKLTLRKLPQLLGPQATMAIVTFHSLEDKIVKDFFKEISQDSSGNLFERINKKVVTPNYQEIRKNPRARSAKLRGVRRVL